MTVEDEVELSVSRRLLIEQRDANEALVRLAIRAQERSEEAELAKDLAIVSEREQRALVEFRETFIGILGHDLRNPLSSIMMTADALIDGRGLAAPDEARVGRILRNCDRMTRMITQLLDVTRARLGGGMPLTCVPTDLGELAREVLAEFSDRAVRFEAEGDLTGTWDPDRLAEVFSNVVGNAVAHAAPGTPVVVTLGAAGDTVVVAVANRGESIPADVLPILFEPFRRGRAPAPTRTGNLGLGLYISHQIVSGHGGTIAAHSSGGTTTFTIRLPRARPPATHA